VPRNRALLVLADGTAFAGRPLGARGETVGEVVFTTGMTGYQETLTDPSYCGQIVTMTAPQMGNTGVNAEDPESARPFVAGFAVKEASPRVSSYRADGDLHGYLESNRVVGIQGIDTRALTRHVRDRGAMMGVLSTECLDPQELHRRAAAAPGLVGRDLVPEVTCKEPIAWTEGRGKWAHGSAAGHGDRIHVVAFDFGVKRNILRSLVDAGCKVTVVPARTTAAEALAMRPDGVFLSNGPGDPAAVTYAIDTVRALVDKVPLFGICLGHQILGLALGGRTYKLKFGHRGLNQPVIDLSTGKVEITTQNHGFAVDVASMEGKAILTHRQLNDDTVEGFRHASLPVFSVQYHPEAAAGPHDASYLFDRFVRMVRGASVAR
jgi:carbamoyl-phosphate synthase small subunit